MLATMSASALNTINFTSNQLLSMVTLNISASRLQPIMQDDPSSRTGNRGTSKGTR